MHVAVDYSINKSTNPLDQLLSAQVMLSMDTSGSGVPIHSVLYYDNVRLTPEPATMVLMGLGGLVLTRRKK